MTAERFFDGVRGGLYAFMSLAAGGLVAGLVTCLVSLFAGSLGLFIGIVALAIWPIGMICVGGPVWALLHLLGRRSRSDARLAGSVGGGLSVLIVGGGLFAGSGEFWPVVVLGAAGTLGGLVGGSVVWTMAYGGRHDARA
ncbi:hypothetical protein [Brevundimonas sp. M20]|uniref:hypothetical protein n=1 Tax=Brevundimonas sp. M20 TaxID=2591463 RepID=UPI00114745F7|nr:hypothetical protein [Brevundimonas sp. M20]QDH72176.1 hypothetical protein FKQ52_01320 [Brevundimonas sp. M20]